MRHVLSDREQLAGVEAALASRKTPRQFRAGLRRRAAELRKRVGKRRRAKRPRLVGWFRF